MKGLLTVSGLIWVAVASGCASSPAAVAELDTGIEAAAIIATAEEIPATYDATKTPAPLERETRMANWYSKQARRGLTGAQNNLGVMFAHGRGVPKNYVVAYAWCELAALTGHDEAARNRDSIAVHMDERELSMARELSQELVRKYTVSSS